MERIKVEGDNRAHPFSCFRCGGSCTIHRLHDAVWLAACPDYWELKLRLKELYPKDSRFSDYRAVLMCFRCIERSLGRLLTRADFADVEAHSDLFYLGEIVNRPIPPLSP